MTLVKFAPQAPRLHSRKSNLQSNIRSTPFINIIENNDAFEIHIAVPGIRKSDINLDIAEDQLTIQVNQEDERNKEAEDRTQLRKEFDFTAFKKSFRLNEDIDQNKIDAELENGILLITLNKKEEAKTLPPRSITIK